jgi:hypothetical protein
MLNWQLPLTSNQLLFSATDDTLADGFTGSLQTWLVPLSGSGRLHGIQLKRIPQGGLVRLRWVSQAKPAVVGWTQPRWSVSQPAAQLQYITVALVKHPLIDQSLTPTEQQRRLKATFLHEVGHVLGLDHVPNPAAVMHYRGWQNSQLTPTDVHLVQSKYARILQPAIGNT